ncbi:uncharacterized protein LOC124282546 [Haliotis rubra]|uniref:uncharacterized protein LOC124282546 n=1 Tax=Haliotis rubra TaxID=36100 RepID=UPI001EE5B073|nr:uncharacterized protein LOC124282546 [Haliotis rubra]
MGSTSSMQRPPPRKTADAANSSPGDTRNQPVNNLSKTQSDRGGTDITQKPAVNSVPSGVDTEAEMKKLREDASHLNSEFDEIDTLIQELKADAFTKTGKYSRIYNWRSLGFEDYADTDRRKLGEYLAVSDAAEVLNAAFDTLLKSLGFTCMWPIKMDFEDKTQVLVAQKLSMIRMIVWNNTDGSLSFAEKVSKAGMLKYFVEDLKQMDVEDAAAADDDDEDDDEVSEIFTHTQ